MRPSPRWPAVDGLRAAAIVPVLMFHLEVPGFALGWTGVNLFFVISGFLITGILLDTRDSANYLRNFFVRRALRIFPIYYLALAAVALLALQRGWPAGDAPYYVFYLQNIPLGIREWQVDFPAMFNHTWSLAIEEQFYWLWPFVIWRASRRSLVIVLTVLMVVAWLSRWLVQHASPGSSLFGTLLFSQLDALAAGGAVCMALRAGVGPTTLRVLAWAAFALGTLFLVALVRDVGYANYWNPGVWLAHPHAAWVNTGLAVTFAAILLLAVVDVDGPMRILRSGPMRHVGIISYGLYLYHFPVFAAADVLAARVDPAGPELQWDVVKLTTVYGIALTSWHLIERPFLDLKSRWAPTVGRDKDRG